jgi:ribose/xylose/arabinose/galactoside ABC-type transport system permease subunit
MGRNPWYWFQGTAVGQMAPFLFVALLLIAAALLAPPTMAWRQLLLNFGLVGLVTLGVTFPLMKGHYDFSAGTLAGLAACTAAILSPYGFGTATAGALAVGAIIGLINGYFIGWTRINSAMVTVMTGAIALQLTLYTLGRTEISVTDPTLLSIAETDVGGVPVILTLFILALAVARVLFNQETFKPVGSAQSQIQAVALTSAPHVMLSFLVSGLAAGLAGLLIACSSMSIIGSAGQMVWMLTPLTAALIGGGSVAAGTGNLRTATIGAASIALVNWLVNQLRMPIAGPIVEAPLLIVGLLSDRWKGMTWYMISEARRGNLLALPEDMQLPMVVRVWRKTTWPVRIAGAAAMLTMAVGLYLYVAFYIVGRVPEGTAVLRELSGVVQVTRYGSQMSVSLNEGDMVKPGDTVTTGRGSRAFLRFADGSMMRLYPNSELYIQDLQTSPTGSTVTELRVMFGAFFAKIHKLVTRDSTFTVTTPVLTLGVRGTAFQLAVGQGQGSVAVGEGSVAITQKVPVEDRGLTRYFDDTRTVDAGRQADAGAITLVRPMALANLQSLQATAEDLAKQARRKQMEALHNRAYRGAWVFALILYLIFILCLRPEPPSYIFDVMSERAQIIAKSHSGQRSAADSPRSATLAQMYVRAGDLDAARAEIQSIMKHDPNSEYGQWAQRYWLEFERMRKRADFAARRTG